MFNRNAPETTKTTTIRAEHVTIPFFPFLNLPRQFLTPSLTTVRHRRQIPDLVATLDFSWKVKTRLWRKDRLVPTLLLEIKTTRFQVQRFLNLHNEPVINMATIPKTEASDGFEKVLIGTRGARETLLQGRKGRAAKNSVLTSGAKQLKC